MYPSRKAQDREVMTDAVVRASAAAESMPRAMDSLLRAMFHDRNLYTPTYLGSVTNLESARLLCVNQYVMSSSYGGQLLAAFNTGMMLERIVELVPEASTNRELSRRLSIRGFGERQVWAYLKFASEIARLQCYKALVVIHDLPWSVVGRHPTTFVELLVSGGSQAFVVDE
jgi:hypothetical protein